MGECALLLRPDARGIRLLRRSYFYDTEGKFEIGKYSLQNSMRYREMDRVAKFLYNDELQRYTYSL